jgi:hypothetical protein
LYVPTCVPVNGKTGQGLKKIKEKTEERTAERRLDEGERPDSGGGGQSEGRETR